MKIIEFYKLQASGNDFILIDNRKLKITSGRLKAIARNYCRRKLSIGADGLLVIEPSKKALFKMRIFNVDGSEAQMCGNGARCSAFWYALKGKPAKNIRFETKAGIIESRVGQESVTIKLSDPKNIRLQMPINVLGRKIKVDFINSGVPHAVIFVEGLAKIKVEAIGRAVRFHKSFKPSGTNVDFVELLSAETIALRTYERGVEAETLACGTGSVAAAIISVAKLKLNSRKINVLTRGGEILKVYFDKQGQKFTKVWLEGKANLVYKGGIYV
ncbi:MAG: diaminopimelate epimerase [Candidatus Omnitrophica bacterium]|nr:diaminopimelate epimerase [Candidatus Omnitrophota bacterium]MBU2044878.1 diaminopimelate epimerase [Candidatus Omnitrophota bacterium]MBU2473336.1 diaminopimelate epimerase [Candidatus Omnitrophota bacterium]